jgi:muramidase (phage lysozyme)
MATGTGLPLPNDQPVLAQAPGGVSGSSLFSAQAWSQIAADGEKIAKMGGDQLRLNEHQAKVGYLADQEVDIATKRAELRNQFANDPTGFQAAWDGYSQGKLGEADPRFVPQLKKTLGSEGVGAYSSILNETRAKNEQQAKQSWLALEDQASNAVTGAAMAGTLGTPDGQAAIARYRSVVATGVTSQFLPQAAADQRIAALESTATVYATRDGVQKTFEAGGPQAAVKQIDEIVRDEKLNLSPEQRLTLGARLRADVHAWDAERTQNLATVDLEAQSLLKARQGGVPLPQSRIDEVVDRYKRFGGQAQAASFLADVQHSEQLAFLNRVPPNEAAAWVDQYKNSRFSTVVNQNIPPEGQALLNYIARGESAGRYNVRYGGSTDKTFAGFADHPRVAEPITSGPDAGKTSSAAGRYQFIGSTWDDQARKLGLKDFSPANQDAAAWNLAQEEYRRKTGNDLLSVMKSGDKAAIADIPRQLSGQWSSLPGGRQPAKGLGEFTTSGPSSTPSDNNFIGRANALVSKRVTDAADAIVTGMNNKDNPVLPTAQQMNDLVDAAAATNTPEVLQKVSAAAAEYQFRRDFGRAPLPQETGMVDELQRRAVTEGLNPADARRLQIASEIRDRTAKALADDPLRHTIGALADTASLPPPTPLNVADPKQFKAGLQARAAWAEAGTRTFQTQPMPALTTPEVAQVRAALDAATDPAAKARIYSTIASSLPPATRAATLVKLGAKGVDGMVEVQAGAMMGIDPAIGESIIRGQSAMKAKDAFNPTKGNDADNVTAAMDKYMPAAAFSRTQRTDPTGAYAVMRGAVLARAADLAATDPNFDGKFTDSMIQRAVNDVTGGIVTHNGAPVIAPLRGGGQRDFDARLYGLTDAALAGVTTSNGTPITAEYVRNNAQLESYGDGRYLVRLGRDPERPIYAFQDIGANVPNRLRPFVLDLRNVKPSPLAPDPFSGANALP